MRIVLLVCLLVCTRWSGAVASECGLLGEEGMTGGYYGRRAEPGRKVVPEEKPTASEIQEVIQSWWTVKNSLSLRYIGTTIAMTFLKLYPEYIDNFAKGFKKAVEELPNDKQFVAKSVSFIYDLSSLLDNLNDLELVEVLAKSIGHKHAKDGATATSFDDIRNLMLHLVARYHKQYSEMFPRGIEESTTRTLNWIFGMMRKGLET